MLGVVGSTGTAVEEEEGGNSQSRDRNVVDWAACWILAANTLLPSPLGWIPSFL